MRTEGPFQQAWLTETLRLREAHWGQLQDSTEVRRARSEGGTFAQRIIRRAQFLGRREKLDQTLAHWSNLARWSLAAMFALAVLAGIGAAIGALGDGVRSVNLLLALVAMLGLHLLTLILWLVGTGLQPNGGGAWLGRAWLSATRKLARGPDAALAPRALVGLLGRSGGLHWTLGAISHLLWLTALTSLLATLLALLSARRYTFNWETTLLTSDAFVALTQALGWLPAQFGFTMPSEATIRLSDGLSALPQEAQALWSSWLIGCVVVYGVFPRLVAGVVSAVLARRAIRQASRLDTSLPGYANLRPRLAPQSETITPDAPPGPGVVTRIESPATTFNFTDQPLIVGLELAPAIAWPPESLPQGVQNAGVVDSRPQRHALLDQLHAQPVKRLLIVCDSNQTPDRGALAYIAELATYSGETHIAFMAEPLSAHDDGSRLTSWRRQLLAAGFPADRLHADLATGLAWLNEASHDNA